MSSTDKPGSGTDALQERLLSALGDAAGVTVPDSGESQSPEVCQLVERRRPGRPRKNPPAAPASVSSINDARRQAKPETPAAANQAAPEKPKKYAKVPANCSPLEYLEGVFRGKYEGDILRVRAAIAAAQYRHIRQGDGGKKEERQQEAARLSQGRFASGNAPTGARLND